MPTTLSGRDLLSIADLTAEEIRCVLDLAAAAKAGADLGRPLEGRTLAMIFQRPSNRTRVSFEVAAHRLGAHPIPLFAQEIQIGERESVADVSRILDRYVDGVVARLTSHRDLTRMAQWADGPVINAMTDVEHPCQVLADCMTVIEATGSVEGAKVAYVGDGNNVCTSWLYAAALLGVDFRIVCPQGYEPRPDVLDRAESLRSGNARFTLTHEKGEALEEAQIIYTDVWTSMGQEAEQQRRREDFAHLQVNESLLTMAPPSARVMHCLPAHRGEEITDRVIDGPQSIVFDQAENRMWVQQALLALVFGHDGARAPADEREASLTT
ncbi:MAG TPA: ornithine carbamoyltransferase [Candidatus Angelobacter sp.]|jgi:ornithine carbamoyltransferase|nr:ornithine carbamoyltransferase [Candidatus Angelobacter sp.]